MEIDKETAELIVEIYNDICNTKHFSDNSSFIEIKKKSSIGNSLSSMLNESFKKSDTHSFIENLSAMIDYINEVKKLRTNTLHNAETELDFTLSQLKEKLLALQTNLIIINNG